MDKIQAIAGVIDATLTVPVVFTTGYACRIANGIADRPNHFYMTGSMGLAANIGTGIALALGRTTVVVDGDGSLAMNPGCLLAAGAMPDLRLLHIVLDDATYASTGGQPSPTRHVDFTALAKSSGYAVTHHVDTEHALADRLTAAVADCPAPTLLHCTVTPDTANPPPRIDVDLADHAQRFAHYLHRLIPTTR
jgi:thiamine pyrophosphate-dependent acetolactate synthase large subunit-like protein